MMKELEKEGDVGSSAGGMVEDDPAVNSFCPNDLDWFDQFVSGVDPGSSGGIVV